MSGIAWRFSDCQRTERLGFDSQHDQTLCLLHKFQRGCGEQPTLLPCSCRVVCLDSTVTKVWTWSLTPFLVQIWRKDGTVPPLCAEAPVTVTPTHRTFNTHCVSVPFLVSSPLVCTLCPHSCIPLSSYLFSWFIISFQMLTRAYLIIPNFSIMPFLGH
jgi:hypothetical protein